MSDFTLTTPVALIIFNRPDTTEVVFEAIRRAKPSKLLIIADGPRLDRPDDAEKCAAAKAIIERVDWPCEVLKNYSSVNLGCGVRPSTGISWVFEQVEEAIILEDDCVPHPTFFRYCQELLERYRDDERIMHIAGNNSRIVSNKGKYSYYFSLFPHCWGWATWRRAWRYFDFEMKLLPEIIQDDRLNDILHDRKASQYWTKRFQEVYGNAKNHIWDYQWTFACWTQGGLSILPNVILISNIGFDSEATHTKTRNDPFANLPVTAMDFPLRHPRCVTRDSPADGAAQDCIFNQGILKRVHNKLTMLLKR